MQQIQALKPGGTIAIIAPASPQRVQNNLLGGMEYFRNLGYTIVESPNLHSCYGGYLAGTDEQRTTDLLWAFENPAVDAIMCARGGFGSARLLNRIDWQVVANNPKLFVGFSDITALQLAMYSMVGMASWCGALPSVDFAATPNTFTEERFWAAMNTSPSAPFPTPLHAFSSNFLRPGSATGPLLPVNLSMLCSIIGTGFLPNLRGCVLVVEDVGEDAYRIDRLLTQLEMYVIAANQKPAALVYGDVSITTTRTTPTRLLQDIIADHVEITDGPILTGLPFGHIARKLTLPMGALAMV
jgi:muramoyltetrapeptide carboxypeptidase